MLGRAGALLRDELSVRWRARRWGRRVRPGPAQNHDQAPPAATREWSAPTREPSAKPVVPAHDPELAGYYANLELPYGADRDAIREARRRLLKRYHPDLHSADPGTRRNATRLSQGLNRAHDELVRRLDRKQR